MAAGRLGNTSTAWSPELAYTIGFLVTDGTLSPGGKQFDFVSGDVEQLRNFMKCLGIKARISRRTSGGGGKEYAQVQIGNAQFYDLLTEMGLIPRKGRIIGEIAVPDDHFFDFLRGHLDGDSCFYSYRNPRWRSTFMFYLKFASASRIHVLWLRQSVRRLLGISGHLRKDGNDLFYTLKYDRADSLKLLRKMYYNPEVVCLSRKRRRIERALGAAGLTI